MPRSSKDVYTCSSASSVTSSFYFEGDQEEDEEEKRELKFEPLPVKVEILDEEQVDRDDDYEPEMVGDDDEEWGTSNSGRNKSSGNRKRPSPMSLEEKREKERERMRLRRQREKEAKISAEKEENVKEHKRPRRSGSVEKGARPPPMSEQEKRGKAKERMRQLRLQKFGNRQRAAPMTPEEKRVKERERMRNLRERRKREQQSLMDEEKDGVKKEAEEENGGKKEESESCGRRRAKRMSEMTPEKAERVRVLRREQAKRRKERSEQQLNDALKKELESDMSGEDENDCRDKDEDYKPNRERNSGTSSRSRPSSTSGGRRGNKPRKRISEMTDEEKEFWRARWKKDRERKRERYNQLTPQEKEELKKRTKRKRSLKDEDLTEERRRCIEEVYRKDRERQRLRRAALTPEQREEQKQKYKLYRLEKLAKMSEDELRIERMHKYMQKQARNANLTPEELERRRKQHRDSARKRWTKIKATPGAVERWNEKQREWRKNMSIEKKRKWSEMMKKRYAAVKQDPEKMEKLKVQQRECTKKRRERREQRFEEEGSMYSQSAQDQINNRRRRRITVGGVEVKHLTVEQRREKARLVQRRRVVEKKLKIQQMLDSGMSMEEIQEQTENPEKRERELIKLRIRKHRRKLRARLKACGVADEEIERQVQEWEASYEPVMQFRPYKAMPERWKRVDHSDVKLLNEKGLDVIVDGLNLVSSSSLSEKISSSLPTPKPSTSRPTTSTVIVDLRPPPPPRKRGRPATKSKPLVVAPQQQEHSPAPASVVRGGGVEFIQPYRTTAQHLYQSPETYTQVPPAISMHPHQQQHSQIQFSHINQTYSLQHHQNYEAGVMLTSSSSSSTNAFIGHQIPPVNPYTTVSETSSQYADYSSSYGGEDDDNGGGYHYSPPASPPGDNHEEVEEEECEESAANPTSFSLPHKKPRKRKKYPYVPRPGCRPRCKRSEVIRDSICDECGEAFNRFYLKQHQAYAHNPNFDFKNKICRVCNAKYGSSVQWYKHYMRDHAPKKESCAENVEICPDCGKTFLSLINLRRHHHFTHGEGTKKENYFKCPVCPGERMFKDFGTLQRHLRRSHPAKASSVTTGKHLCSRCDGDFINERELGEHIRTTHPQDYFPCEYCKAVKFTQLAMNFHYGRCSKLSKERREEIAKKWEAEGKGTYSMERIQIRCVLCQNAVNMSSLERHYREVHGVTEDKKLVCPECPKEYNKRAFLACHLEEVHCKTFEEMEEHLRQLRTDNREGLKIPAIRPTRGRKKKEGEKRKRRNIVVVCEEEENGEKEEELN